MTSIVAVWRTHVIELLARDMLTSTEKTSRVVWYLRHWDGLGKHLVVARPHQHETCPRLDSLPAKLLGGSNT